MVRTVATRSWSKVKIVIVEDQRNVKQWTSAVWPEMTSVEHQDVQWGQECSAGYIQPRELA